MSDEKSPSQSVTKAPPEAPAPADQHPPAESHLPIDAPERKAAPNEDASAKCEFLWKVHSYTNEYIRFADAKAGFVVGFASAVLWALFAGRCHEMFIVVAPRQWNALAWLSLASYLLLLASILASITAVRPRLWAGSSKGLIFWKSVTRYGDMDAYTNAVLAVSPDELPTHLANHVYALARVSGRKYAWVNAGILALTFGGLLGIAVLMWKPLGPVIKLAR
jgi:hypothetical protein